MATVLFLVDTFIAFLAGAAIVLTIGYYGGPDNTLALGVASFLVFAYVQFTRLWETQEVTRKVTDELRKMQRQIDKSS